MSATTRSSKKNRGARRSKRGGKVVRSIARARSSGSIAASGPLTVPTRWVKFIFAIFLLPLCCVLSQTFFTAFARATVAEHLWAGEEFWFFSLGVFLWLIAFFGLPRPVVLYVFGHELTHALWVWMMGGRVSRFKVGRHGGHILTDRNNFLIALAPYFFPIYSILVIALYGALSLFLDLQPYGRLLYALIGVTWAFHLSFTIWMIPKGQTDLSYHGNFFSLIIIYLMNVLVMALFLIVAAPEVSFESFGSDLVENARTFSVWAWRCASSLLRGT